MKPLQIVYTGTLLQITGLELCYFFTQPHIRCTQYMLLTHTDDYSFTQ
jgi:hypothetical protein